MIDFERKNGWTVEQLSRALRQELSPLYGDGEALAMTRLIFHALKGWNATQLIINSDVRLSPYILGKIKDILARLRRHEPLQYILGEARFYGLDLKVDRNVLIPRPETEELVDMIVSENQRSDLRVLDIGTGSGAIAIALSRNLPFSQVTAIDVSEGALNVARENARNLHAKINFIHADVFDWTPSPESFDIIVSNPPYIAESERGDMERNVLDYEPGLALFVSDGAPLVYYSRIAAIAADALSPGGKIYLEINPRFAEGVRSLLAEAGFTGIGILKDISGRDRFAVAERSHKS